MKKRGTESRVNTPRPGSVDIAKAFAEGKPIDDAVAAGVRQALRMHKKLGNSIAIWRDGKVVILPPEEIPCEDEE